MNYGYELAIPDTLSRWTTHSSSLESISLPRFTTEIKNNWDSPSIGINIYHESICPPLGVNTPQTVKIDGEVAHWGRTDFWDKADAMYQWRMRDEWAPEDIPPFCAPSLPEQQEYNVECTGDEWENCPQKQRDYEVAHGMYSAYAFCAEKDGKAVAICIQQMTDDEDMAREIFESFDWTD